MLKKLHMSLIISILEVSKLLISNQRMYNLYAIFAKYRPIRYSPWMTFTLATQISCSNDT